MSHGPDLWRLADWRAPEGWLRISTLDAHTEGEPFRVVSGGFPQLDGTTMVELRRDASRHHDHLRRALMLEPRGHADMYGCVVTPPVSEGADFGVLFMHNEGFSTMCGHGIIAIVTVALETGLVPAGNGDEPRLRIDTPAGLVEARARLDGRRVRRVAFRNVPSFVVDLDCRIEIPEIGPVSYDLAFGGAFYAYVDAASVGLELNSGCYRRLIDHGLSIKHAIAASRAIRHPFEDDLSFLYGVVFTGPGERADSHSRNVCVFADGEVDRSPTGTSVSARLALHHARGELLVGQPIWIESLLGTRFGGRIFDTTTFGPHAAVIPEISGQAFLTGRHEFFVDPDDPLGQGFLLR